MDKILTYVVLFTLVLIYASCATKKDQVLILSDSLDSRLWLWQSQEAQNKNYERLEINSDTIFTCGKYGKLVFDSKHQKFLTQANQDGTMRCLCEKAYDGDENSVDILTLYYDTMQRGFPCKQLRGKHFFELRLDYSKKFSLSNPETGTVTFDYLRKNLYEMMRSIDSYPPSSYSSIYIRTIKGFDDVESSDIMIEDRALYAQLEYESILYAWKNNLIVFKDFGEQ